MSLDDVKKYTLNTPDKDEFYCTSFELDDLDKLMNNKSFDKIMNNKSK